MSITLADAKRLTNDSLSSLVIDEFRKDILLDLMVFDNTVAPGSGSLTYVYNRVTTQPSAAFRAINSEYVSGEAATTRYSVDLKPFGGSFSVDRALQSNVKGATDLVTFQLEQKIKATKALFADAFINGDSTGAANSFDGVDSAVTGTSTEVAPTTAIDLTSAGIDDNYMAFMDELDNLLSLLDDVPSALIVNRKMAAVFNGIARRSNYFMASEDSFGKPVTKYAGIPIVVLGDKPGTTDPIIPTDTTAKTTSIYAVRFGLDGVHAVCPDGQIIHTYLPDLTTPGVVKKGEVEMICATAVKSTRAVGVLRNIKVG